MTAVFRLSHLAPLLPSKGAIHLCVRNGVFQRSCHRIRVHVATHQQTHWNADCAVCGALLRAWTWNTTKHAITKQQKRLITKRNQNLMKSPRPKIPQKHSRPKAQQIHMHHKHVNQQLGIVGNWRAAQICKRTLRKPNTLNTPLRPQGLQKQWHCKSRKANYVVTQASRHNAGDHATYNWNHMTTLSAKHGCEEQRDVA